jgi:hypothetical protein
MNTKLSTDNKLFTAVLSSFAVATVAVALFAKPATVSTELQSLGQVVVTGKRVDAAQAVSVDAVRLATVVITAKRADAIAARQAAPSQAEAFSARTSRTV